MVWTAALTNFADGNTPTHTQLNEYIANTEWMHAPPTDSYEEPGAVNFTTVSTNWAQISADFALSINVGAGAHALAILSLVVTLAQVDIEFDGTRLGSTPAATGAGIFGNASTVRQAVTLCIPFFNLSAGAHTFTAVYKATSGTATIYAESRPRFHVREL